MKKLTKLETFGLIAAILVSGSYFYMKKVYDPEAAALKKTISTLNAKIGEYNKLKEPPNPEGLKRRLERQRGEEKKMADALRAAGGRTEAEAEVTGGLSPRVLPMGEIRDLGALLQRGGLALPVADSFTQRVLYADAFRLMADLRAMGEGNALAQRLRRPTRRQVLLRAAQIYAVAQSDDQGRIPATFEMICLTGWAPHDSQPRPLRPGSAATRLADALNTLERPLGKGPQDG